MNTAIRALPVVNAIPVTLEAVNPDESVSKVYASMIPAPTSPAHKA
jgi:hypothetical protein